MLFSEPSVTEGSMILHAISNSPMNTFAVYLIFKIVYILKCKNIRIFVYILGVHFKIDEKS
jgi:hypothetical protein